MHGAAGFTGDGLGHEGGVHVVAQRGFTHRAFEEKHLVGQAQRVVMEKIDFHLTGADFMDQGVDVQPHFFAVLVQLFKQRVEFVDRINAVGLARSFGPAAAPDGRPKQGIRVGVARQQIKLEFGCYHRLPTLGGVQITHMAQYAARGKRHQLAVAVVAIVNHLGGRVGGPRHDAHSRGVGHQMHVAVVRLDDVVIRPGLGKVAGHAHGHHRFGQAHAAVFGEFFTRQDFPARHTGQVGHQAFDFGDAPLVQPIFQIGKSFDVLVFVQSCHGIGLVDQREGRRLYPRQRSLSRRRSCMACENAWKIAE